MGRKSAQNDGAVHAGHRKRLRDRFLTDGLDSFEPHNIMELLLFYAVPRRDTNELAHTIINRFGSLSAALEAPKSALIELGLTENAASLLKLVPEIARVCREERLDERYKGSDIRLAGEYLVGLYDGDAAESVIILAYNAANKLKFRVRLSHGLSDMTAVPPLELAKTLIERGAAEFVLAHNHPGGLCDPSQQDLILTKRFGNAFSTLGIPMLAHYVISDGKYKNIIC